METANSNPRRRWRKLLVSFIASAAVSEMHQGALYPQGGTMCFAGSMWGRWTSGPLSATPNHAPEAEVSLDEERDEDSDFDDEDSDMAIPKLTRSAFKQRPDASDRLDIDTVTSFVQGELGEAGFKVAPYEQQDFEKSPLQEAAAAFRQWALRREVTEDKQELIARTERLLSTEMPEPHTFASLMWCCSKLSINDMSPLLAPLRDRMPEVARDMTAQNLTSCWCTAAKIQEFAEEVDDMIPHLLGAALKKAKDMEPRHVAAFVWASGKLDLRPAEVSQILDTLPGLLREDLDTMQLKDIANFVFGLSRLECRDTGLMETIAKVTAGKAESCNKKAAWTDLPMIVMSLTRLGYKDAHMNKLLDAVAARLQRGPRLLKKMPDWGLAALLWSWPSDGVPGVRDMQGLLYPEVDKRIAKNRFDSRMLERSWMGPSEWQRPVKHARNFVR
ncbi:unnamed protein product [Effrenium voratum]|uniref:Uncharacterized protein n=1 Tax=Effrenium voratum TaxID=2562239 RepID=A0AA36IGD8_9DINO|nr:unnamed protein product [Effrenium voratum]CAJ1436585.1 unnamed protein product [Effrenium voratum]